MPPQRPVAPPPIDIPKSAVSVEVAEVQASGSLVFHDADGHVVYACACQFKPLFYPHADSLAAAIAELTAEIGEQLTPLPTAKPTSEVE